MVHLTEKPVELATRAIQYSSRADENVLDLFGGSGSTLIACQQTGRRAYVMELDPLDCDVIVQRWENFTGQKAKRVKAGRTEAAVQGQKAKRGRGGRSKAARAGHVSPRLVPVGKEAEG